MKRTESIDLNLMRKSGLLKPLALGVAAASLVACSSREDVKIVTNVNECVSVTNYTQHECEAAYQKALKEASRTAPRYTSLNACTADFGIQSCRQSSSGSWFMPAMAGFMIGQLISPRQDRYSAHYNPIFDYHGRGYHRDSLMTADGYRIGKVGQTTATIDKQALKPKPTPRRTVSRGGFGAVASAKSSWGGGKSGGWGG